MYRTAPRVTAAVMLALAMASSACRTTTEVSSNTVPGAAVSPTAEATAEPTVVAVPTAVATALPATPESAPTEPAATAPTAVATSVPDLAGEPWDLWVPALGEIVAVAGVAHDDILEIHEGPGENTPLIGTLPPLADDAISLGEGRLLPASIWWRISYGDVDGWVGSGFMTRLGVTLDITSQVIDELGSIPAAETMVDLGMIVANQRASEDPPSGIVMTVAPTVGDLGEVTFDVVGFGDDAVEGERLHIFGQPLESGEGFSLMAVEATVMCLRGVSESDLCI